MKKILSVAVLAAAISSIAAPVELAEIRIASQNELVRGATKAGEYVGYPALGTMAFMGLANIPYVKTMGALRPDGEFLVKIYSDGSDVEGFFCLPVSRTKEAFLAANPSAVDKGAYVAFSGDKYVFSPDGKWASETEESLTEVTLASMESLATAMPLKPGTLASVRVSQVALDKLREQLEKEKSTAGAADKVFLEAMSRCMDGLTDLEFSVTVDDLGIDISGSAGVLPGSALSRYGEKPFTAPDPLAFAGNDSLFAMAFAQNCSTADTSVQFTQLLSYLRSNGISLDWISCSGVPGKNKIELDVKALYKYIAEGTAEKEFSAIQDPLEFVRGITKAAEAGEPYTAPEQAITFSVKGVTVPETPSARFAAAMPDIAGKPLCVKVAGSYNSAIRAVVKSLSEIPEFEFGSTLAQGLMTLPSEKGACVAGASWVENSRIFGKCRLTPQELKGLGAICFFAGATIGQFEANRYSALNDDNEDDEDDDGDDDED